MSRATVHCLVIVLVLLNLIYRYPLHISHEAGADTTFIHTLASSVANEGYAEWVLNPISLFGLYALSYPSGVPFLLAEFSGLSGLSIEGSILVFGMVLGVVGSLGTFLVSRDLLRRDSYAFLAALLFSLAPFFLKDTTWVGSSRGAVVALIPILLWVLIRAIRFERPKYFVFSIMIFLLAISLHRMGFLIVFFFISFFFISSIHRITQRIRFALFRYDTLFRTIATITALSGFFLLLYVQILFPGYGGFNIVDVYGRGTFFEGSDFLTMMLNMAVNFVGKVGILIPLSMVGLVLYVWKRPKMIDEKFVLVITLLLIPFLSLRDYISEFLILFFVFMAVFVISYLRSHWKSRRKMIRVGVILFLILSLAFSWVMKDYWRSKYTSDTPISESDFDAAMYFGVHAEGIILTNFGLMAGRISALTEGPVLPLGGASTHWHGPQQLIFGTSESANLLFFPTDQLVVRRLEYDEITFTTDEIFAPADAPNARVPNTLVDWEDILRRIPDDSEAIEMADKYDIHYVVVSKTNPYKFMSYGWRPSLFLESLQLGGVSARYKIFENSDNTAWFYR